MFDPLKNPHPIAKRSTGSEFFYCLSIPMDGCDAECESQCTNANALGKTVDDCTVLAHGECTSDNSGCTSGFKCLCDLSCTWKCNSGFENSYHERLRSLGNTDFLIICLNL